MAYLVPDTDVSFVPLITSVEVCSLGDVVAQELQQILALLVSEAFEMSNALGVDIERFIAGCLCHRQTQPFTATS
jgi:hypothetical protein